LAYTEEFEITDGKKLLYLVFGATTWDFERIEMGTIEIQPVTEGCLDLIRATTFYLLKNWKHISASDRAQAMDGMTHWIKEIKESGLSIRGTKRYNIAGMSGDKNPGSYVAYLKIIQDEE